MSSQDSDVVPFVWYKHPTRGFKLRAITDEDGTFWFVADDVCWDIGRGSIYRTFKHRKKDGISTRRILNKLGNAPELKVINEETLCDLIRTSDDRHIKEYRDWVCLVVLPSLRKLNPYHHKARQPLDPNRLDTDVLLDALINVQQQQDQIKATLLAIEARLKVKN